MSQSSEGAAPSWRRRGAEECWGVGAEHISPSHDEIAPPALACPDFSGAGRSREKVQGEGIGRQPGEG